MIVQMHANGERQGNEELVDQLEVDIPEMLNTYADQITRLEIHLDDENSHKGGDKDKRCTIEARVQNIQPIAVTNHAGTIYEAAMGAADKMLRTLDSTITKRRDARQPSASTMDPAVNIAGPVDLEE